MQSVAKNYSAWVALLLAGLSELVWAYFMKQSDGFRNIIPSILFISVMLISMGFLTYAVKYLPISVTYPIWVGIGAVGTVIIGMVFFNEAVSFIKLTFLSMIILGVIGLKMI
jgi:quaternary ammonium compound-resistance protein SugE